MRTPLFIFFIASVLAVSGQTTTETKTDNALARVDQVRGIYIFIESTPVSQYDYIATVKKTNWINNFEKNIEGIIKNAIEECPNVDGLIICYKNGTSIKADCIKFK